MFFTSLRRELRRRKRQGVATDLTVTQPAAQGSGGGSTSWTRLAGRSAR
jgi:hypothetical protein